MMERGTKTTISARTARRPTTTETAILAPMDSVAAKVPPIKSATGMPITSKSPIAIKMNTTK